MKRILALLVAVILAATAFPAAALSQRGLPFSDVKKTDWFYDAVSYTWEGQLFQGVSENKFDPKAPMTRAMVVTVLANLAKAKTNCYKEQHFVDVAPGQWYAENVEWAALHSLVSGVGGFQFKPRAPITREQMATLLFRFAQATGNDTHVEKSEARFSDKHRVSGYARLPVDWAIGKGILNGVSETSLNPRGALTRAQAAQIFYNARSLFLHTEITGKEISLPLPTKLDKKLYSMTLEEKVGQLFLPRYPGSDADDWTTRYHPAGYTLYEKDFQNKSSAEIRGMLQNHQNASKTPLFLAVDEEGGTVVRVSSHKGLAAQPFDSPQNIYKSQGLNGILADTQSKAELLLGLGINLNLAPVCDISTNPKDYIYHRTLGLPAQETAKVISALVEVMEKNSLSSTLKHFPGYGNNLNTHSGISIDLRPYEQFVREDFLPFQAGIAAGAPSVLVSHNIINAIDPEKPASLSKPVHDILRNELGFEGAILTDDLSMDAIKEYTGGQSPAVTAFLAGNDLLLTSDWEADYMALLNAVKSGTIPMAQVEDSVRRILSWKESKGLLK